MNRKHGVTHRPHQVPFQGLPCLHPLSSGILPRHPATLLPSPGFCGSHHAKNGNHRVTHRPHQVPPCVLPCLHPWSSGTLPRHPATLPPSPGFGRSQPITHWHPPGAHICRRLTPLSTAQKLPGVLQSQTPFLSHPDTPRASQLLSLMVLCLTLVWAKGGASRTPGGTHFCLALVMVTHPPAGETLLAPALTHIVALPLAIVTHWFTEGNVLVAESTVVAIVTPQLCRETLLPASDPAAGHLASGTLPHVSDPVGNAGDIGDHVSPSLPVSLLEGSQLSCDLPADGSGGWGNQVRLRVSPGCSSQARSCSQLSAVPRGMETQWAPSPGTPHPFRTKCCCRWLARGGRGLGQNHRVNGLGCGWGHFLNRTALF